MDANTLSLTALVIGWDGSVPSGVCSDLIAPSFGHFGPNKNLAQLQCNNYPCYGNKMCIHSCTAFQH